jgi:uncharacterized membrane protein
MKSLQNLKALAILFGLLALFGFVDASYLTAKHYLGTPIPCSIFGGCDIVTGSAYSAIGPVPIALLGALYYLALLILAVIYLDSGKIFPFKAAAYGSIAGFLVSIFLVYLQIFVIRALCLYCMISATICLILFLLGQGMLRQLRTSANMAHE